MAYNIYNINIMTKTITYHFLVLLPMIMFAQNVTKDCAGTITGTISLTFDLYQNTCPEAEAIIFTGVERAIGTDPRMAASLLRMHFHDCFVNGCDASLLLDDTVTFQGEKTAAPNLNSLRGFEVIDDIKSELESVCPQTVSCADILTVVARDSVALSGGPTWEVEMGRRDSLTASLQAANNSIPTPTSDVSTLTSVFQNVGLSQKDMVALSGAHTIGKARCRFSTGSNRQCGSDPNNAELAQLDEVTPIAFDNFYFKNLLAGNGFLPSDQTLVSGNDGGTVGLVQTYAQDLYAFFEDFKDSMVRMGRLGSNSGGEIRRSCRVVN